MSNATANGTTRGFGNRVVNKTEPYRTIAVWTTAMRFTNSSKGKGEFPDDIHEDNLEDEWRIAATKMFLSPYTGSCDIVYKSSELCLEGWRFVVWWRWWLISATVATKESEWMHLGALMLEWNEIIWSNVNKSFLWVFNLFDANFTLVSE